MEDYIEQYHENHEVEYKIMATIDGEVIAYVTSGISADDVAGSAWQVDQKVQQHISGELADAAELAVEAQTEELIEEGRNGAAN